MAGDIGNFELDGRGNIEFEDDEGGIQYFETTLTFESSGGGIVTFKPELDVVNASLISMLLTI